MKYLISLFLLVISSQALAFGDECKAISWKAERESNNVVVVQGSISKPNTLVSIELWKLDRLIGTASTYSNDRGVFLRRVYTEKRAPKYPNVVLSCR
ncbi:hypothetical protein [Thiomicrorhabdus cannonii]|uniref:hypothetical protein n=1 Tax=Thiomicrorhabdus cannonii TaxID=2748011 RepID=UPI0015BCEE52|nr:hypothetical protein [Thiomicrorhabdus cannonii]